MAGDPFSGHERFKSDPCRKQAHAFIAAVGGDITLDEVAKALYVGGAGDLHVVLADDPDSVVSQFIDFKGVFPFSVRIIKAATNATNIQPAGA